MGNKVAAMKESDLGGSRVQVVLLNGQSESFQTPVTARTVMRTFPQHIVIHCSAVRVPSKSKSSRHSKRYTINKTVLKPQHLLKAEQDYLIVPKSSTTSDSIGDSWVMFAFQKQAEKKARRQRVAARQTKNYSSMRKGLASIFHFTPPGMLLPDERKRSLSLRYEASEEISESTENSNDKQAVKWKRSSSYPPHKSNKDDSRFRGSQDRRKRSTWHRFPKTNPQGLPETATDIPALLGCNWQPAQDLFKEFLIPLQPSPYLFKEFLIPLDPKSTEHRMWKPALSCIPEFCRP